MTHYDKSEKEVAAGRLWRAKEILQGQLRSAGYDIVHYERYGNILLQLGDLNEAGKYLFLSGIRKPEYQESINIFMGRHAKSISGIYGSFPAAVRSSAIASFPESVRAELQRAGFDPNDLQRVSSARQNTRAESSWAGKLASLTLSVAFILLFSGFIVQCVLGLYWLVGLVSGN